jgi:ABC-2 type transport system ATP-binding protein
MIEIKNLTKTYRNKPALYHINLTIPRGQLIGLFGENGAGKTTLLKCILNLLSFQGEITLDGEPITHKNIAKLSFATSEHSFFPNLTALHHKEFYQEHFPAFNEKRFDGLMEFFNLPKHRPIKVFSTGQKNQFEVILSLSQGADYILMDEPFSGNDLFNREDFYKVLLGILEPNETILLSTHLIDEVSGFLDRVILLKDHGVLADVSAFDLEEEGKSLTEFVKESYHYQKDRVSLALDAISGKEG